MGVEFLKNCKIEFKRKLLKSAIQKHLKLLNQYITVIYLNICLRKTLRKIPKLVFVQIRYAYNGYYVVLSLKTDFLEQIRIYSVLFKQLNIRFCELFRAEHIGSSLFCYKY